MPKAGRAGPADRTDLKPSPALSILANGPDSFKGRKLGVLVSDGVDAGILQAVQARARQGRGAGQARRADGRRRRGERRLLDRGDEKIDGGPSVVFDAVAILLSGRAPRCWPGDAARPRFRRRCLRPSQFIAYIAAASRCWRRRACSRSRRRLRRAGFRRCRGLRAACRKLRFWEREAKVKQV